MGYERFILVATEAMGHGGVWLMRGMGLEGYDLPDTLQVVSSLWLCLSAVATHGALTQFIGTIN
jgi:hypothetical protein